MDYTLASLYDLANWKYQRVTDIGSEEITSARWKGLFNEALDQLDLVTPEVTSTLISLVADQQEYDLPADFHSIFSLAMLETDTYRVMDRLLVTDERGTGYRLFNGKIYVQPTPETAVTDGLKLIYFDEFAGLPTAEDEVIQMSDAAMLIDWALFQILLSDGDAKANTYFSSFERRKQSITMGRLPQIRQATNIWG